MNNQVLSIPQMQELIALGVDTSKASLYWSFHITFKEKKDPILVLSRGPHFMFVEEYIPTFTLQDILEILPTHKSFSENYDSGFGRYWIRLVTADCDNAHTELSNTSLLEAAFLMLKWCKENNYL